MNPLSLPNCLKWIRIEEDWFESEDGGLTVLNDPDLGWTLLENQSPPAFLGNFPTLAQALGKAEVLQGA